MGNGSGELKAQRKMPTWVFILVALLVIAALAVAIYSVSSGRKNRGPEAEIERRLALADRYLSELKYDEAIAEYNAILEISPKCTEAYLGVANVYKVQDNYPAIIQFLEDAKDKFAGDEYPEALREYLEKAYEIARNGQYQKDWTDKMMVYGDARFLDDGSIELTPLEEYRSGCVWLGGKAKTELGFALSFSYWAGGGRDNEFGGADGFAIALADKPQLGMDGGFLGFPENAVGMEIDSFPYNENDPGSKHFAIIKNRVSNHVKYVLDDRTDDSKWHTVTMLYHNNKLDIYLDSESLLSMENANLPKEAYIGITASTGSGFNRHLIKNFLVTGAAMIDEFDDSLFQTPSYGDDYYEDPGESYYSEFGYDPNASASISATSDGQITIKMTADSIRELYDVGTTPVEENHTEYSWAVGFTDGTNEFRAGIDCWRYSGSKVGTMSIYDMQRSLWYNGSNILNIDDISLLGNTVTLTFRIPKNPPDYAKDLVIPKVDYSNLRITYFSGTVAGEFVSFGY